MGTCFPRLCRLSSKSSQGFSTNVVHTNFRWHEDLSDHSRDCDFVQMSLVQSFGLLLSNFKRYGELPSSVGFTWSLSFDNNSKNSFLWKRQEWDFRQSFSECLIDRSTYLISQWDELIICICIQFLSLNHFQVSEIRIARAPTKAFGTEWCVFSPPHFNGDFASIL